MKQYFGSKMLIGTVRRDKKIFIPDGQSAIRCGDKVIAVTKSGGRYNTLNDIFR